MKLNPKLTYFVENNIGGSKDTPYVLWEEGDDEKLMNMLSSLNKSSTCSTNNDDSLNFEARVSFLQGYITGKNDELLSNKGKGVSRESLQYALEKYCRENSLHDTWDAARSIYKELK